MKQNNLFFKNQLFKNWSVLYMLLIGLLLFKNQTTYGQCPDYGNKKIAVENDSAKEFYYPNIQVQGDNIFVSGGAGIL